MFRARKFRADAISRRVKHIVKQEQKPTGKPVEIHGFLLASVIICSILYVGITEGSKRALLQEMQEIAQRQQIRTASGREIPANEIAVQLLQRLFVRVGIGLKQGAKL